MLQKLNERVKGVVAWIIVILIAFTFTLFGIDYYLQSRNYSDSVLEVDGVKLSKQEFEIYYRRARQQIDLSTLTKKKEQELKDQIMQDIVNKQVALSSAEKNGFYVDAQQANAAILAIPQFQEDGKFSTALYQQALSSAMYTPESFQQEVRQGLLMNQQRFAFMGTEFALPYEVNRFIKLYYQQRDYDYLVIPVKSFLDDQNVSAQEAKQYYDAHQSEFLNPEQISVKYILLSLAKERQAQDKIISDKQVRAYYEENKQNFIEPAKWQVARILIASDDANAVKSKEKAEEIAKQAQANPEQFDALKAKYTDDKLALTKDNGLPWITAGQGDLGKVLMHLKTIGQVSAPVKTKYGYEIFQVKNYTPASAKPYEDVSSLLRQQLVNTKAEKRFNEKLESLTDLTFQTPDSLDAAAKSVSEPLLETSFFTRKGGSEAITKHQQLIQSAFSHDVLDLGNNSELIQIDGDTIVFLRIKEHKPATEKSFDAVAPMINAKLRQQKAEKFVRTLGQSFVEGKISAEKLASLLKQSKLDWKEQKNVARESDTVPANVNHLAFVIQSINRMAGKSIANQGYLIVRLTAIHPGKKATVDVEQRNSLRQQLESNLGIMAYDLYINGLIYNAKVDSHINSSI
jgi:peptidyl-prolyl cis-trans isomerase D